ncbi:hypothetical protein V8G54_017197 [Vigna mungo]|uniref:Uncharacterized protein n=1 Tax=Vigna mungo TaxID=3915 RepID=A0AAQ3NQ72_VIGMU
MVVGISCIAKAIHPTKGSHSASLCYCLPHRSPLTSILFKVSPLLKVSLVIHHHTVIVIFDCILYLGGHVKYNLVGGIDSVKKSCCVVENNSHTCVLDSVTPPVSRIREPISFKKNVAIRLLNLQTVLSS